MTRESVIGGATGIRWFGEPMGGFWTRAPFASPTETVRRIAAVIAAA